MPPRRGAQSRRTSRAEMRSCSLLRGVLWSREVVQEPHFRNHPVCSRMRYDLRRRALNERKRPAERSVPVRGAGRSHGATVLAESRTSWPACCRHVRPEQAEANCDQELHCAPTPGPGAGWSGARPMATASLTPARTPTPRRPLREPGSTSSSVTRRLPQWSSASSPCTWPGPAIHRLPPPSLVRACPRRQHTTTPETGTGPATYWARSAVRAILDKPRYLGHHVSGRTKKADVLLDPDHPMLGHVTRQQWQDKPNWVTAEAPTYPAIIDEATWQRARALAASNTRTTAVTPARRSTRDGTRRSVPSRYPLVGLVICGCCGKKLQGNMARGLRFLPVQGQHRLPATARRAPGQPGCARRPPPPPRRRLAGEDLCRRPDRRDGPPSCGGRCPKQPRGPRY